MLNTMIKGFQPEIIDTLDRTGLPYFFPFVHCITFMEPRRRCVGNRFALRQGHLMVELIAPGSHRTSSGIFNVAQTSHTGTCTLCLERRIDQPSESGKNRACSACFWLMSACSTRKRKYDPEVSINDRTSRTHPSLTVRL